MSAVLEQAEESDGFSETCPFCGRTFTDPNTYIDHVSKEHREWTAKQQQETLNFMLIGGAVLCLAGYWYYSIKKEKKP